MTGRLLLLSAFAASLSACDDGAPAERGFGSRQLVPLRDSSFQFKGSRGDVVLYSIGSNPPSYLSIDLRTSEVAEHNSTFSDIPFPQYTFPPDPNARYHCSYGSDAAGNLEFRIDDAQTGTKTTIAGGTLTARCPTDDDPTLKMWRYDDTDHWTLWTGRYDDLQKAPVDLDVVQILQGLKPTDTAVSVLAGRPALPDARGIFSVDLATFAVTELVPPVLADGAWADGATSDGSLESASLYSESNQIANDAFLVGDHFGYWRTMADGSSPTLFVGPIASGPARELALFRRDPSRPDRRYVSPAAGTSAPTAPSLLVWQRWGADVALSELLVWDDPRRRLLTCPSALAAPAAAIASSDRSKLAMFVEQNAPDVALPPSLRTGPLLMIDLANPPAGATACTTLAAADVSVAGVSPDGTALFWLLQQPYPSIFGDLWLAAADGSAARSLGSDLIEAPPNAPHFVGPSQLEIDINADLVWIDTHDPSALTHAIAEHVRGGAIDRGRWLITGYEASEQDGNAKLGVVNRDTGDKHVISPGVVTFFSPDIANPYDGSIVPSPFRTAGDPFRIVYLVRGRNPAAQDGLWVATINARDIP